MDYTSYLETLSNDSPNPCYFADIETFELLYLNKAMLKVLKDYHGYSKRPCYEVIHNKEKPCTFCPNKNLESLKFHQKSIYSEIAKQFFRCTSTKIDLAGKFVNMSKYFSSSPRIRGEDVPTFEKSMAQCAEILSQEHPEEMLPNFLSLLAEYYEAEKVFVFRGEKGENLISTGDDSLSQNAPDILPILSHWRKEKNGHTPLECNFTQQSYPEGSMEAQLYQLFPVENLLLVPLYADTSELNGYVAMVNRSGFQGDYRLLTAVSRFVQESFSVQSMTQELSKLNDVDQLTGCYNRRCYGEKLKELQENPPEKLGILFINLNGLRKTNEFFGYEVGDIQILKTLAQLRHHFQEDYYRISGDEFISFLPEMEERDFHSRVEALQTELHDSNNNSFSVGSAWNHKDYDVMKLVATADTVMYINKQEYYYNNLKENPEMAESMLQDLLTAVGNKEFLVYLQPKVELATGKVTGAEALVRRYDPVKKKMEYPNNFIPKYEKNAIVRHVDLYVLEKVCQILTHWGETVERIPIAVNLSRVTLTEYGIVKTVTDICDKYAIPRNLIMLEVTERVGLMETDVASTLVEDFQQRGFKISLDDFGCAYSNIVTLAQISVDEVKLDKSLIDDLIVNPKNKIILENMINMCNALENTTTLAEGIELEGQADSLKSIQCRYGQGYLYSKPVPHEEFFRLFIKKRKGDL